MTSRCAPVVASVLLGMATLPLGVTAQAVNAASDGAAPAVPIGVMKQSNEQSLEEAKSRLAREAQDGQYVFKAIHGVATAHEAESEVTAIRLARDLTFHEVDALLELAKRDSASSDVRRVQLPSGTRPGFLAALTELIHGSVGAHEFELLYGTSGARAEIPVHVVYQPRWWLQVELFLDDADQS